MKRLREIQTLTGKTEGIVQLSFTLQYCSFWTLNLNNGVLTSYEWNDGTPEQIESTSDLNHISHEFYFNIIEFLRSQMDSANK